MINSKDISVVIQGQNIKGLSNKCCASIRKYLPGAEIIFSTYKNEDVSDLDIDILIESDDPGATLLFPDIKKYNNINRILTTTKAGLEKVKRRYCVKMRSDLIFENNKILNDLATLFPKRDKKYSIFKQRVVFYPLWSRKQETINNKVLSTPFCLSDWFCFGLTEDIQNYFNSCPMTKEPDYSNYYKNKKHYFSGLFDPDVCWRFPPEQWFGMNFFSRYFQMAKMRCSQDINRDRQQLSDVLLVNNVIIAGYGEIGVYNQKGIYKSISKQIENKCKSNMWLGGVYKHAEFLNDYKKYCDSDFIVPYKYRLKNDLNTNGYPERLKKHCHNVTKSMKQATRLVVELFACVYYVIKIIQRMFATVRVWRGGGGAPHVFNLYKCALLEITKYD